MAGISFTDEREYLPNKKPKMTAIENLNDLQIKREKIIDNIIHWKHKPNNDRDWDKLARKYSKYGYQELIKLEKKIKN